MRCQGAKVDGLAGVAGPRCNEPATHVLPDMQTPYCERHARYVAVGLKTATSILGIIRRKQGVEVDDVEVLLARWRVH